MIPILYESNETKFTSQGLGRLSDATLCEVVEERNGIFELEMEYPVDGIHFKDITHSRIILAKPADGANSQPFRIYKIGKPLGGRCSIYAQHVSYQTVHIPVMPFSAQSFVSAFNGLKTNAAEDCPFTLWTDKVATGAFSVKVPTSFRTLLGGATGSLLDVYGTAEYEFDRFTIYARVSRGTDRGVVLRYGKNITDLKQEENIQNTITGICPYWMDRNTETAVTLPEQVLWSSNASNFPYKRTIPVDFTDKFESEPTAGQLRQAGQEYIQNNDIGVPDISINVSFIPLWQTEEYKDLTNLERVNLCDTITVVFDKLGVSATAKVVKTVFDVLADRYSSIEIGTAKTTLATTIVNAAETTAEKIEESTSMLQWYVNHVTEMITGGQGGYIMFVYNANDQPEEMLIMDTPSASTATSIIRLNKNGIAFSTDGGATYKTGWTIDGVFSADFIGAGTLDANLIRAGRLQDVAGTNYWDMVTGEFRLASTVTIDGETLSEHFDDYDQGLSQTEIFNRLTNNGATQGIYMQNGLLYINASYINSGQMVADRINGGTLTLGGYNNANGTMVVNTAGNQKVIEISNKGVQGFKTVRVGGTEYDMKSVLDAEGLTFRAESTTTMCIAPLYSSNPNDDPYTGFCVYKPLYFVSGGGGNVGFRFGGLSGSSDSTGNYGAMFFFGNSVRMAASLTVEGTKSRDATTDNYGHRLLYCYEMPSPMFGDIGEATLDEDGLCYIDIDDIFSETIRSDIEYQVFLQKEGPGDLWVAQKERSYFVVQGTPGLKFAWELKARQAGYETQRLEMPDRYPEEIQGSDLEHIYDSDLEDLINEQEAILYETAQ